MTRDSLPCIHFIKLALIESASLRGNYFVVRRGHQLREWREPRRAAGMDSERWTVLPLRVLQTGTGETDDREGW